MYTRSLTRIWLELTICKNVQVGWPAKLSFINEHLSKDPLLLYFKNERAKPFALHKQVLHRWAAELEFTGSIPATWLHFYGGKMQKCSHTMHWVHVLQVDKNTSESPAPSAPSASLIIRLWILPIKHQNVIFLNIDGFSSEWLLSTTQIWGRVGRRGECIGKWKKSCGKAKFAREKEKLESIILVHVLNAPECYMLEFSKVMSGQTILGGATDKSRSAAKLHNFVNRSFVIGNIMSPP